MLWNEVFFPKCCGRLLTKQKRAAIVNVSTHSFGLSIHFQVLHVAFVEPKKEENKRSKTFQRQNLIHVTMCLPQKVMSEYLLSKTAKSRLQEILLFLLHGQIKLFQRNVLTDSLNYK